MTILVCPGWGWGEGFCEGVEAGGGAPGGVGGVVCACILSTWTTDCLVEKQLRAYCEPQTKGEPSRWLVGRSSRSLVELVPFQRWGNRGP